MTTFIKILKQDQLEEQPVKNRNTDDFTQFNLNDEKLLGMASILLDEGYGTFDRCYGLIRCLRGDLNKARKILSEMIQQECHN